MRTLRNWLKQGKVEMKRLPLSGNVKEYRLHSEDQSATQVDQSATVKDQSEVSLAAPESPECPEIPEVPGPEAKKNFQAAPSEIDENSIIMKLKNNTKLQELRERRNQITSKQGYDYNQYNEAKKAAQQLINNLTT